MQLLFTSLLSTTLTFFTLSWANPPEPHPCGVIQQLSGDVEILDSTHTHLSDGATGAPLACDSWISVNTGLAILQHHSGMQIHLGPHSFAQILSASSSDPTLPAGDHFLLYEGPMYFQQTQKKGPAEEFHIITANGRARMKQGQAMLIANPNEDTTQLVSLEHQASLENRFENSRSIVVHAGESTTLNFKVLRTLPSAAQAISVISLKKILATLRLTPQLEKQAFTLALSRQKRSLPSALAASHPTHTGRHLASLPDTSPEISNQPSKDENELKNHLAETLTGSDEIDANLILHQKNLKKNSGATLQLQELSDRRPSAQAQQEDHEKKQLIEELSKIQME